MSFQLQKNISYILFDASGTLIQKPLLWERILDVLQKNGYKTSLDDLQKKHKLLSEIIHFPDRTSKDFYAYFNAELLYALGIVPNENLLDELFDACTYLPWEVFEDTSILKDLPYPIGILSNFNSSLQEKMEQFFGNIFQHILISEVLGVAKPNIDFYKKAIATIAIPPEQILYIGDSLKLDIKPALEVGMQPLLIDRHQLFGSFENRLDSLNQLIDLNL